jgi:hypothetical protein
VHANAPTSIVNIPAAILIIETTSLLISGVIDEISSAYIQSPIIIIVLAVAITNLFFLMTMHFLPLT